MATNAGVPVSTSQIGQFNAPDVSDRGKAYNRPIETALQAFEVYQRFERDNLMRAVRNKSVADMYNGATPFEQKKLNDVGQGWRSNWSVLALAMAVNRIKPRILRAVNDQKSLTDSALPSSFPDAEKHSAIFQAAITKLIRRWSGWSDYLDQILSEDVLYGYTGAVHLDLYGWRPRTFRQEELLFDEQTSQFAGRLACFVVKVDYRIDEILELLQDWETAQEIGYDIENLIHAVKMAAPPRMNLVYDPRQLSDMVREANIYYTYHRSTKMVETAHIFVLNYEGKVDHWWVNRSSALSYKQGQKDSGPAGGTPSDRIGLYEGENVYKTMEDLITLFSFEPGNNRLFGSKGMGRWLYNPAMALDKVTNAFLDGFYLSKLVAGKYDSGKVASLLPQVRNPFFVLPDGFEPLEPLIEIDFQTYEFVTNMIQRIIDQIAGTYMPEDPQEPGTPPETATQSSIDAQRENEISDNVVVRFWNQLQLSIGAIQRRACNKDNMMAAIDRRDARKEATKKDKQIVPPDVMDLLKEISDKAIDDYAVEPDLPERVDEEAVSMIDKLMEDGLTAEEIVILANAPSSRFRSSMSAQDAQMFLQWWTNFGRGNPFFDQAKGNEKGALVSIGPDATKELFIPKPDQTSQLEEGRQQMGENALMTAGQQVPVSPRDDHMSHLQVLEPDVVQKLQQMQSMPPATIPDQMIQAIALQLKHGEDHLNALLQTGMTKQDLAPQLKQLKAGEAELKKIQQAKQKAVQEQAVIQQQMAAKQAGAQNQPAGPHPEMSMPPGQYQPPQPQGMPPPQNSPQ